MAPEQRGKDPLQISQSGSQAAVVPDKSGKGQALCAKSRSLPSGPGSPGAGTGEVPELQGSFLQSWPAQPYRGLTPKRKWHPPLPQLLCKYKLACAVL